MIFQLKSQSEKLLPNTMGFMLIHQERLEVLNAYLVKRFQGGHKGSDCFSLNKDFKSLS